MDIQTTVTELEKLPFKSVDSRKALDDLRKLCDLAWHDIIEYSAIHFNKINDEKGFHNWKNLLMEMEKSNLAYRQLRDYVSIDSKLEIQSEKQK